MWWQSLSSPLTRHSDVTWTPWRLKSNCPTGSPHKGSVMENGESIFMSWRLHAGSIVSLIYILSSNTLYVHYLPTPCTQPTMAYIKRYYILLQNEILSSIFNYQKCSKCLMIAKEAYIYLVVHRVKKQGTWWRHQMETFSALLIICAGNSPVPGEFPAQGQWRGALMFSLICTRINGWVNNGEAADLRRHRAHYDVAVMKGIDLIVAELYIQYNLKRTLKLEIEKIK